MLLQKRLKSDGYEIDEKTKQIMLTESGVEKAERYFKLDNLYDVDHTQLVHHITQALKANYIMKNEVEYVVQDDEIVIVDTFTGRTMPDVRILMVCIRRLKQKKEFLSKKKLLHWLQLHIRISSVYMTSWLV